MAAGFKPDASWAPAVASGMTPQLTSQLTSKMQPAMEGEPPVHVVTIKAIASNPQPGPSPPHPHGPPPPPPGPAATCVDTAENKAANIGCPAGRVISTIDFASFGSPSGTCSAGFKKSTKCDSTHTMAVVSGLCVGKNKCAVHASCSTFHEELQGPHAFCWDVIKHLAVKVNRDHAAQSDSNIFIFTLLLSHFRSRPSWLVCCSSAARLLVCSSARLLVCSSARLQTHR